MVLAYTKQPKFKFALRRSMCIFDAWNTAIMLQMQDKMSKKYHRPVEVWVPVLFDSFLQNIRKCYDIEIYVF